MTADVTVSTVGDSSALDTQPDARQNPPSPTAQDAAANGAAPQAAPAAQSNEPLPTNRQFPKQKTKKPKQKNNAPK